MTKRVSGAARLQSSKAARVSISSDTSAPPIVENSAALELVNAADGLSPDCRQMLESMVPHCLGTPCSKRHAFQAEMLQIIFDIGVGLQSQKQEVVAAVAASVVIATADAQSAAERLVTAEGEVARSSGERDEKAAVAKSAADAVIAAKQACAGKAWHVETLSSERACVEAETEEYEGVVRDALVPLKDGALIGQPWQEMLNLLLEVLGKLGVDQSLLDALPLSLKLKAEEERGYFANVAVAAAEGALQKHVTYLADQFAAKESEVAERAKGVQLAQEALGVAETTQGVCFDSQVVAENALQEAELLRHEVVATIQASKIQITQQSAVLDASRLESTRISELLVQFTKLREGVQETLATAIPEEEVALVCNEQDMSQAPVVELDASMATDQELVPSAATVMPVVQEESKGDLLAPHVPTMHAAEAAGA